ncbi:MAG: alpha/beta fold hydrolase [Deltaproteobacteria bacterium]|nr:alpha/beta fold hydrolase [Deltaproteobacteria bacterium]
MARHDPGALQGPGDPRPRRAEGRGPAVLALHGYGGTPLEVELVVDAARAVGLAAHAPLLPGHGVHASELSRTRYTDWLDGAERALDELAPGGAPVIIVGLSMGSLLAAELALRHGDRVVGLGMLANATRLFEPYPAALLRTLDRVGLRDFSIPKSGADIADPAARASHATFGVQPIGGAIEVLRAGERLEPHLRSLRCPALVAHGARDHVCPVANAHRVARALGGSYVRVLVLPRSFHIVTRDLDRELLAGELQTFLARVSGGPQRPVEP